MTPSLQAIIAVVIMLVTILEHITTHVKEITKLAKRTVQAVRSLTTKVSQNKLLQNIKDSYKTATLAITIVTNAMDRRNCSKKPPTTNRNTQISLDTRKLNNEYGRSYQVHNPSTPYNSGN